MPEQKQIDPAVAAWMAKAIQETNNRAARTAQEIQTRWTREQSARGATAQRRVR
jgi:hypothetical protein